MTAGWGGAEGTQNSVIKGGPCVLSKMARSQNRGPCRSQNRGRSYPQKPLKGLKLLPLESGQGWGEAGPGAAVFYCLFISSIGFLNPCVQSFSHLWLFVTPWIAARQAFLSFAISQSLFKFMPIKSVMPSNHLILCRPLLLLPSVFPSIRVFSNESVLRIRWPKYWSFSFSISPYNEYLELISFRMDWLDLLAVQGTLKSLLQHHSSKASILQRSAFYIVQLSHPYMTTGKTIALTRRNFVGKVMSLLFNMLSRLVITFLPRSKRLLILKTYWN